MNAPGDFYVEDGRCITCGAPHDAAPALMAWTDDNSHCFFRRQPSTKEEVEQAIQAVRCSEVCALRYAGNDPDILRRLKEAGMGDQCDATLKKSGPAAPSA